MKKLIKIQRNKKALFVYWVITDYCNQHCNYCPKKLNEGWYATGKKAGAPTDEEIDLFTDYLIKVAVEQDRVLVVSISGGEPTTHRKYPYIVNKLKPYGFVETITNAARPLNWWKSLPQLPHNIVMSLHPEYYDARQIRINELSEFFVDSGVSITYNLCCDPNYWEKVLAIVDSIDDRFKSHIVPKPIFDFDYVNTPMREYTAEQISYMKSFDIVVSHDKEYPKADKFFDDGSKNNINANKLAANSMNHFKGWKCSAGSEGIDVRADGNVWAGICRIKLLGRLSDFKLLDDYVTCTKEVCPCPADINLSKFRQ
jgi:organic radical activating enzyme